MANTDILQYLRETPRNTNVNVVKGMIGNGSGGSIEMTTVFDEDIILTYDNSSSYTPATGKYNHTISSTFTNDGILRFTYENIVLFAIPINGSFNTNSKENLDSTLPFISVWCSNSYTIQGNFEFVAQTRVGSESEFEAYCQTPHHLKIEWFTI